METKDVVVGVAQHRGGILLMKRVGSKKYYPGKWENSGGYLNKGETREHAVLRELFEETGLKGKIIRPGEPFRVMGSDRIFVVHPFLVEVSTDRVRLNYEHDEFAWIPVEDYKNYDCVDGIEMDYKNLDLI
jgi:8-oxo-dGTP diphosphatase